MRDLDKVNPELKTLVAGRLATTTFPGQNSNHTSWNSWHKSLNMDMKPTNYDTLFCVVAHRARQNNLKAINSTMARCYKNMATKEYDILECCLGPPEASASSLKDDVEDASPATNTAGPAKTGLTTPGTAKSGPQIVGPETAGPPNIVGLETAGFGKTRSKFVGPKTAGPPKIVGPETAGPPNIVGLETAGFGKTRSKFVGPKTAGPPKIVGPETAGPPNIVGLETAGFGKTRSKFVGPKTAGPPKIVGPETAGPPKIVGLETAGFGKTRSKFVGPETAEPKIVAPETLRLDTKGKGLAVVHEEIPHSVTDTTHRKRAASPLESGLSKRRGFDPDEEVESSLRGFDVFEENERLRQHNELLQAQVNLFHGSADGTLARALNRNFELNKANATLYQENTTLCQENNALKDQIASLTASNTDGADAHSLQRLENEVQAKKQMATKPESECIVQIRQKLDEVEEMIHDMKADRVTDHQTWTEQRTEFIRNRKQLKLFHQLFKQLADAMVEQTSHQKVKSDELLAKFQAIQAAMSPQPETSQASSNAAAGNVPKHRSLVGSPADKIALKGLPGGSDKRPTGGPADEGPLRRSDEGPLGRSDKRPTGGPADEGPLRPSDKRPTGGPADEGPLRPSDKRPTEGPALLTDTAIFDSPAGGTRKLFVRSPAAGINTEHAKEHAKAIAMVSTPSASRPFGQYDTSPEAKPRHSQRPRLDETGWYSSMNDESISLAKETDSSLRHGANMTKHLTRPTSPNRFQSGPTTRPKLDVNYDSD
ncbi:hypothetical protein CONLIGDRAFT_643739 [Coniochaeta ligniaria NRRL 30616]|uniref:Uncharacterized protein n=1 Tax=Coniochaeta ligniaria NRRL 30616 TaxID=1408157 RepID=A0A1J7IR28_9PEZI|nr:hypothetical protein CONLIGDRAFT_643739 [Coniochaeta ligniaria NRRL 30616]